MLSLYLTGHLVLMASDFRQDDVLKPRVNWRPVRSDVEQMPWGAIACSPVMVDILDAVLVRIIDVRIPRIEVRMHSGDDPWFDELRRAVFQHKQAAYHRWRS